MRTTIIRGAAALALLLGATGCGILGTDDDTALEGQEQGTTEQEGGASDGGGDPGTAGTPVEADDAEGDMTDGDGASDASDVEVVDLGETIAESSIEISGTTVTFELKGVVSSEGSMTVQGVLTNSGRTDANLSDRFYERRLVPDGLSISGAAQQMNDLTVTDSSTGNVHTPAYTADGACLCTTKNALMAPGEALVVTAQYAPLPAGTESVTVAFGPIGSFSNVPVTWS